MDNEYKIIGDINISDKRKDEFNSYVLKLLKIGGIRKTEEISINGKTIKVVEYPVPDENGIVSFNYSIFENREREFSYFDTNTCQLYCTDRGFWEYGVVMNLLMTMQVAYSESACILLYNDAPFSLGGYAVAVKQLLGLTLDFTDRSRCWENILLLRKHGYTEYDVFNLFFSIPSEFAKRQYEYLLAAIHAENDIGMPENYPSDDFWKIEKETTVWIERGVLNILKVCVETEGPEVVRTRLKGLLAASLEERKHLSRIEDRCWSRLAELSLYELPPVFVRAFVMITGEDFWTVWESFEMDGYMDIICLREERGNKKTDIKRQLFWMAIKKDEGLGRLEFLSIDEMSGFPKLKKIIKSWKKQYDEISDLTAEAVNIEVEIQDVLVLQNTIWDTHYISKSMVEEFQANAEDIRYKKAMYLYKQIIDEDIKAFPEMTRNQVLKHVIRYTNQKEKRNSLQAYAALLCNVELRGEVLGF